MIQGFIVHAQADGFGPRDRMTWTARGPHELTPAEAQELQRKGGYDPKGYGFFDFKSGETVAPGVFHHTWQCSASCD
jgi:hypothetical protein